MNIGECEGEKNENKFSSLLKYCFLVFACSIVAFGVEVRVVHAENCTIWAWDSVHGWLSNVPIIMDGVPTGFNTPHTFDLGGSDVHSFTVPITDSYGTRFSKWDNGVIDTTLYAANGIYTAQYDATPYDATIWAWENSVNGWLEEPITMDGVATGFSTPHTFTGLTGMHTFTAPETSAFGGSFETWNPPPTLPHNQYGSTTYICSGGTYTAEYEGLPYDVTIWAWNSVNGWLNNLPITMDGILQASTLPHLHRHNWS